MKAIRVDINERYAPFPSLSIIQDSRDAGARFEPTQPDIPDQVDYQDWNVIDGLQDGKGGFWKDAPKEKPSQHQVPDPRYGSSASASSGGRRTLALNNDVIAEILAATWASPSWKACEMEGTSTSWTGTAGENIQKYIGAEKS